MPRLRAVFALLFQVLLLQATVLGGGMACAPAWLGTVAASQTAKPHGSHDTSETPVGGGAHAAHATPAAHGVVEHSDAPTDGTTPHHGNAPSHCVSATGCAAAVMPAAELAVASVAIVDASRTSARVSAPRWTHPAPEPPPPRV